MPAEKLLRCYSVAGMQVSETFSPGFHLVSVQAAEAIRGADRQLEAAEKGRRERLQEADDLRKRTRQARLRELRAAAVSRPLKALLEGGTVVEAAEGAAPEVAAATDAAAQGLQPSSPTQS